MLYRNTLETCWNLVRSGESGHGDDTIQTNTGREGDLSAAPCFVALAKPLTVAGLTVVLPADAGDLQPSATETAGTVPATKTTRNPKPKPEAHANTSKQQGQTVAKQRKISGHPSQPAEATLSAAADANHRCIPT